MHPECKDSQMNPHVTKSTFKEYHHYYLAVRLLSIKCSLSSLVGDVVCKDCPDLLDILVVHLRKCFVEQPKSLSGPLVEEPDISNVIHDTYDRIVRLVDNASL